MYKTVRHGENSLQYKILAQQEEGEASVKRRKPPRSTTAKLIAVIIFLIIGIIASAVLVPLILTNDFIALTGTFQKFSVSTLRRSHSGNHVVVVAKKPYGWSAAHSSVPPRVSNSSLTHDAKKSTLGTDSTTIRTTSPIPATTTTTTESVRLKMTSQQPEQKQTENRTTAVAKGNNMNEWMIKPSPTSSTVRQENLQRKMAEKEIISTTSAPLWYKHLQTGWSSGSSNNFIHETEKVGLDPMLLLAIIFILIVITMFFVLKKTLTKKKASTENESAESKEDKARLLRPSDHEEE